MVLIVDNMFDKILINIVDFSKVVYNNFMSIINNEAVDFIFAFNRFGIRNKNNEPDFRKLKKLEEWSIEYEKKLCPFLLNDITFLCEKTMEVTLYFFLTVNKHPEIETAKDFLKFLDELSPEAFKKDILFSLMGDSPFEITVENIYDKMLNDGLHPGYDLQDGASLIYGILMDTKNFLDRVKSTYTQFYNLVFIPSYESFKKLTEKKYRWHNSRYLKDPDNYLKTLRLTSVLKEWENHNSIKIYFSLFADNEVSSMWDSKTIIIGGAVDKRITQQSVISKSDLFFSCLGDQKRLEIIRLTSKRPWYSSELAKHFDLKPATLSYHINKLVEADLLNIKRGGAKRFYYTLNRDSFISFMNNASLDLLGSINNEDDDSLKE